MHKNLSKNKITFPAIALILIAFILTIIFFRSAIIDQPKRYPLYEIDGNWTIIKNGEEVQRSSLSSMSTPGVQRGDTWTLITTLPEESIPGAALCFHTLQAVVHVTVDGEEVYSFGEERYRQNRMLKRGICMVPLTSGYEGKELSISFTASEPLAFNGLGPIRFGNDAELMIHFMEVRRVALFFGIFLCLYALFQMLCLPVLLSGSSNVTTPLVGSILSLDMGLYILCFYFLFGTFTQRPTLNTLLEYVTLYLLPLCFSIYLYTVLEGKLKRLYSQFIMIDAAFLVTAIALHMTNMVHITTYLQMFYVITFAESIPYIIGARRIIRGQRELTSDHLNYLARRIVYFGFAIYLTCSLLDTVSFAYAKYIGGAEPEHGIPFFTTGAVIFSLSVTVQYFLQGIAHLQADVTRSRLEERAYTDALTGLSNRTRCELEMQRMSMTEPFVILSMDVDNLKVVNDTYGHAEGDRLLSTFADVLKRVFGDMHLVGRMGGDEFVVIFTGSQRTLVDAKLSELQRAIFETNLQENQFRLDVSYGYADYRETHLGRRVRDIYMLADRRMYDSKHKRRQEGVI